MGIITCNIGFFIKSNTNRLWLNLAKQEFIGRILVTHHLKNWQEKLTEGSLALNFSAAGIVTAD